MGDKYVVAIPRQHRAAGNIHAEPMKPALTTAWQRSLLMEWIWTRAWQLEKQNVENLRSDVP